MKILALDLATKTGWAFWDGARLESGVQDFTKQRGESNGMLFLKFNRWMNDWGMGGGIAEALKFVKMDLLLYEQPIRFHKGGFAGDIAIGLATRVEEFCARYLIEHSALHNATLKKWATGKGNASKEEMIQRAMQVIGRPVKDDNEADAILIADYAREKFGTVKA